MAGARDTECPMNLQRIVLVKTPQNLEEAIENALQDIRTRTMLAPGEYRRIFYAHIADFLSNKFGVAVIRAGRQNRRAEANRLIRLAEQIKGVPK